MNDQSGMPSDQTVDQKIVTAMNTVAAEITKSLNGALGEIIHRLTQITIHEQKSDVRMDKLVEEIFVLRELIGKEDRAANIVADTMNRLFNDLRRLAVPTEKNDKPVKRGKLDKKLDMDVRDLELSTRATNAMLNDNILTVRELVKLSRNEVGRMPNVGKGTLRRIEDCLAEIGLHLARS